MAERDSGGNDIQVLHKTIMRIVVSFKPERKHTAKTVYHLLFGDFVTVVTLKTRIGYKTDARLFF